MKRRWIFPILTATLLATFACHGDETPAAPETPGSSSVTTPTQLQSFHFTAEIKQTWPDGVERGATFEGDFVAPDRHQWSRDEFHETEEDERGVIIGTDAWIQRDDEEKWIVTKTTYAGRVQPGDFTSADEDFFVWDVGLVDALSTFDNELETTKNGVDSRRYQINKDELKRLVALIEPGSFLADTPVDEIEDDVAMTFWVAVDENVLISADITIAALYRGSAESSPNIAEGGTIRSHLTLNVTQLNDPDIRIQPPI